MESLLNYYTIMIKQNIRSNKVNKLKYNQLNSHTFMMNILKASINNPRNPIIPGHSAHFPLGETAGHLNDYNEKDYGILITLSFYKNTLNKLSLPKDILNYIEKYLQTKIKYERIVKTFMDIYTPNSPNDTMTNIKYITKYFANYTYNFCKYSYREYWHVQHTFGNLLIRLLYSNLFTLPKDEAKIGIAKPLECKKNNSVIVDFLQNIIQQNPEKCLVEESIDVSLNYKTIHIYPYLCEEFRNGLEILFGIVFIPELFLNSLKLDFNKDMFEQQYYLQLLKNVLLDRKYTFVVKGSDYSECWSDWLVICDNPRFVVSLYKIIITLCFWKDETLYPHIDKFIKSAKWSYKKNPFTNSEKAIKHIIRLIINFEGYLILKILLESWHFVHLFGDLIANSLVELDLKKLKNIDEKSIITKFLKSSVFMFKLVEHRKFKQTKYLFKKYKNNMKNLRNNKGQNLLEVACESYGLNQNIIEMFLNSKIFDQSKKKLEIRNRKVNKLFT